MFGSPALDVSVVFDAPALAQEAFAHLFGSAGPRAVYTHGDLTFIAQLATGPMDATRVDRRIVGAGFGLPASVGLELGLVDQFALRAEGQLPDPLGPTGRLRAAGALVTGLLARGGVAVVLHASAGRLKPARQFLDELRDVRDEKVRPWAAWLDFIASQGSEGLECRSAGMPRFFGRPDVRAVAEAADDDPFVVGRTMQAVKYACGQLAADPTITSEPTTFEVPLSFRAVARTPPRPTATDVSFPWTTTPRDDGLLLTLRCEGLIAGHPSKAWLRSPDDMPFQLYERAVGDLLLNRYARDGFVAVDTVYFEAQGELPEVSVQLFEREGLFLYATTGFARVRAHGGRSEYATERAEFCLVAPADERVYLTALLRFGALALTTTVDGGLKDFDGLPPGPTGPGYLVVPLADLPLAPTRPVPLRMLLPLTPAEYADVRSLDDRQGWYRAHVPTWAAVAARWSP